jgi:dipeptidyl aminopeptidase/acylaminoacyl peptidase
MLYSLSWYDAFDCTLFRESEGEFQYGNYKKEAADLHSVVLYLRQEKYDVAAIVGHSKGGLYASFGWITWNSLFFSSRCSIGFMSWVSQMSKSLQYDYIQVKHREIFPVFLCINA